MKKIIFTLLSFFIFSFPFNCQAWNAVGHKVAAKIAYDNLTPAARSKVDSIFADFQKEYPNIKTFADMGAWADELLQQKVTMYSHWHYADTAFSTDGTPLKNLMYSDNAFWAIAQLEVVVQNEHANPFERARALAFLVHIIPDTHQPLHTVSRISAAHPDGDQGGNLFSLPAYGAKTHRGAGNLHLLWDSGLGAFDIEDTQVNVNTLAATISGMYPEAYFATLPKDFQLTDWSAEGVKLATTFVYSTQEGQAPSEDYIARGKEFAKQRVALGGYRLAGVLNDLLK